MTSERRVAIVTGGARGIGAAVAARLRADGLAVATFDIGEDALSPPKWAATDAETASLQVDVADEQAVATGVSRVADELGPPVVLVSNAGVTRDNLLFKMTAAQWDEVMGVHLRGAFLMSRAVQEYMVAARWGRIVTMSSTSALGNRGQVNYAAAKAGLQGLTKTLAIELGKFGVTANAIAPGFIETEMVIATAGRMGIPYEEFKASSAARIPVGRVGQPADVAATVSFFVRDEASYVSGQVLYLAGGPRT